MYYFAVLEEDNKIKGFYNEDIHGIDYCKSIIDNGGLKLSEELWSYIINLNVSIEFIGKVEDREYTILDKELFEEVIQPVDTTPQPPTLEDRLAALEAALMGVL